MVEFEELKKRLIDIAVDGFGLYVSKKLADYARQFIVKYLKQYSDGALKVAVSLADVVIPKLREIPYIGDWLAVWGRRGVEDILVTIIDKPPFCFAQDENTIVCYNLDTTNVTIKIDGALKQKDTDYVLSGTAEELTISLKAPLAKGSHDLVVVGNKVAFHGKVYV
jgi:hypothetical protein